MDLASLQVWSELHLRDGAAQWHLLLAPSMLVKRFPLADLMVQLAALPELASFSHQLCIWVAQGVTRVSLGARGETNVANSSAGEVAEVQAFQTWELQRMLASHVHSTTVYAHDLGAITMVSICTDKSRVGGLPLQNSYLQLNGQDEVFPALPQVLRCGRSGRVFRALSGLSRS